MYKYNLVYNNMEMFTLYLSFILPLLNNLSGILQNSSS